MAVEALVFMVQSQKRTVCCGGGGKPCGAVIYIAYDKACDICRYFVRMRPLLLTLETIASISCTDDSNFCAIKTFLKNFKFEETVLEVSTVTKCC